MMPAELPLPLVLLLHQGGWDEALMVAAGLGIAYLVIVWTGRRNQDEEDDWEGDDVPGVQAPESTPDQSPRQRP